MENHKTDVLKKLDIFRNTFVSSFESQLTELGSTSRITRLMSFMYIRRHGLETVEPKKLLSNYSLEKDKLKNAAFEIFKCFEMQLINIPVGVGTWQEAIDKVVSDATRRAIKYYKKSPDVEFSVNEIIRGVVKGKTKARKYGSNFWNLADLFNQTGIVTGIDENLAKYYTSEKSNPEKYGYRLLFPWEDLIPDYKESKLQGIKYEYVLTESLMAKHLKRTSSTVATRARIWYDVEAPIMAYVHRIDMFDQISTGLKKGIVLILGSAGMGKSELAKKYAHEHCQQYNGNVMWINASSRETMISSFHKLARECLNINLRYEDKEEKPIKVVVREIHECFINEKSLFIFDSAERFDAIEPFLPPASLRWPHVLVTSQFNSNWDTDRIHLQEPLLLGEFTDAEAEQYVKNVLSITDDTSISELIRRLHNFPLALNQAVAYIRFKNERAQKLGSIYTVDDFINAYDKAQHSRAHMPGFLEPIYKTLRVTLRNVQDKNSLELFDVIAYFDENNIPTDLFLQQYAHGNQNMLVSLMRELRQCSIVDIKQDMLHVASFLQTSRRQIIMQESKNEIRVLTKALRILGGHMNNQKEINLNIAHILSVWKYAYHNYALIEEFVVKNAGFETGHTTFFHLIVASMNYDVCAVIVRKIETNFPKQLDRVLNARDSESGTPAHYAAKNADARVLRLLLAKGAQVDARNVKDATPLHVAAQNGLFETVQVLVEHQAEINAKTVTNYTPLHLAARNGCLDIVKFLVDNGADIHAKCSDLHTPLHFALKTGAEDCVQFLLQKGANPL